MVFQAVDTHVMQRFFFFQERLPLPRAKENTLRTVAIIVRSSSQVTDENRTWAGLAVLLLRWQQDHTFLYSKLR